MQEVRKRLSDLFSRLHSDVYIHRKGAHGRVCSQYEDDGQLRKAEVSNYGGFIFDDKPRKTYEVPEEVRAGWLVFSWNRIAR
jgi:hypothetical protein